MPGSPSINVQETLSAADAKFKPTAVEKPIPIEVDLGNLVAYDLNTVGDAESKTKPTNEELRAIARDATQEIINRLFAAPRKADTSGIYAILPRGYSSLPRAKPIPKDAPLTTWERFAKIKGINKKKKSRKIYDEEKKEWTHRKN